METAIQAWLVEQERKNLKFNSTTRPLKIPYTVYGCMLLLSRNAFQSEAWRHVLLSVQGDKIQRLYAQIATHLKITHIAITKPIPASNAEDHTENIVRAPSNFETVYGNFGPATAASPPTQQDFDAAFWVTVKQNGIYQTWAPRWTMFSRGNISEKARILDLDSVAQAVDEGREDGKGHCAVDLYAGIGYFTFSYLKAGVNKVLSWDLNEWSCEGLKRGAKANHWEVAMPNHNSSLDEMLAHDPQLLVFNESNEHATSRIESLRSDLPPIRHVNCGLLPTSRGSWQTALVVLDPELGGWVHIHENFGVTEIEEKAQEVTSTIQELLDAMRPGKVELDFINRVKSYAPGVMHCVLDLQVTPRTPD